MYRPVLVTPPASQPVTMEQAKRQVRAEDFTDDDDLLEALVKAATSHLDGWTGILGRCLITQTWRQDFDGFCRCMRLPLFPVASIASVTHLDAADATQTVSPSAYALLNDDAGAFVRFADAFAFPATSAKRPAVAITYVAGAESASEALQHAILMLVGHWYANRESVSAVAMQSLPQAVDALIAPYRRIRF